MTILHEFKREERLPSYFANRLQEFLSAARTDLRLSRKSNTEVEVAPVEPYGIAAIDLEGLWRFRDTAVTRAHPGGAGGTYIVWAVGTKQNVSEVPKPFTDETDYKFDLRITSGANPAGAGVEVFERIGEIDWDGAKITALRQTYNAVTGAMLDPAALDAGGDLEWLRQATGALLGQLKENSVTANEIAPKAVAASEIDDTLKPSAGAAAGTESLRALGATASTAAAGNDARLSDERVPTAKSVTAAKVADALKPSAGAAAGTEALRALGETASTAAAGNDARLSDERVPTAKSVTAAKVADALKPSAGAAAGTEALRALGETASTAAAGNDARLSDERTPKAASVTATKVANELKPSGGAAAGTEALRALGSTASTACAGNDARLSDERTPKAASVNEEKLTAAYKQRIPLFGVVTAAGGKGGGSEGWTCKRNSVGFYRITFTTKYSNNTGPIVALDTPGAGGWSINVANANLEYFEVQIYNAANALADNIFWFQVAGN